MSVMTKFLKQKCLLEQYVVTPEGNAETNRFGEIVYQEPIKHICRREKFVKDVQTTNGSVLQSTTRYFFDDSVEVKPDYRIDGHVVLTIEEYINGLGKCVGYEAYV